ncbi:AP-2 complex subunit alpha-1-like protein, partial [Tanacetum coccineum]
PDLSWYVDVILQLIDKARDFVSDDIWFLAVQFVTNNEDLQPYVALKAREYLDKPAIHETMVKVSAYLLGEYSHLLARRPGCSPKEIFAIIHEKLPTSSLIKKSEDTDVDTTELSAIKLRAHQQTSNALVATEQRPANGAPQVSPLGMVMIPSTSDADHNAIEQGLTQANGANVNGAPPTADMLGDLLSPLAIEGPPAITTQLDHNGVHGHEGTSRADDALALAPGENQESTVKPIGDIAERFQALCLKDSGNTALLDSVKAVILPPSHLKLELSLVPEVIPPRAHVQCPLEVDNL